MGVWCACGLIPAGFVHVWWEREGGVAEPSRKGIGGGEEGG